MGIIDTELEIAKLLEARQKRRNLPAYSPKQESEIADLLRIFFRDIEPTSTVRDVVRLGGGASKEQFVFTLQKPGSEPSRYVLRMDPLEALTETDRYREYQTLMMFRDIVPVPKPFWIDRKGDKFGRPAVIMEYVAGVTKPSVDQGVKVTGLGTVLGPQLRELIKQPFLDCLVAIHNADWRSADLSGFSIPDKDPQQSARWQVEYWAELWRQDGFPDPIMTLTENWLRDNLPACKELVFIHGDYRTGNYLFDEKTGEIKALLDWELAYIGDFHDDLAWTINPIFGTVTDGVFRVSDLFEREEFIDTYEQVSGRKVNRKTLYFYEVLTAYKCFLFSSGTSLAISKVAHNHQDVLLTFFAASAPIFKADLCRLLTGTSSP